MKSYQTFTSLYIFYEPLTLFYLKFYHVGARLVVCGYGTKFNIYLLFPNTEVCNKNVEYKTILCENNLPIISISIECYRNRFVGVLLKIVLFSAILYGSSLYLDCQKHLIVFNFVIFFLKVKKNSKL